MTASTLHRRQFRLILSVTPCMPHTSSLVFLSHSPSPLLFSSTPTSSPAHTLTPDSPQDQAPPPPLNPTTSLTSPCSTSSQMKNPYPDHPNYSAPPPQVAQPRTDGHPPLPSLNDPPALGEGTSYTTMPVSPQSLGTTMCVAVLALPHPTLQLNLILSCCV